MKSPAASLVESPNPKNRRSEPGIWLEAISVSIAFGDRLEAVAANRKQFDRWVIVTAPDDHRTRDVCRRARLECLSIDAFPAEEFPWEGRWSVDRYLLVGIQALENDRAARMPERHEHDGWIALMDADLLLPNDFRGHLEALRPHLDRETIYTLSARRQVNHLDELHALSTVGGWNSGSFPEREPPTFFVLLSTRHPAVQQARGEMEVWRRTVAQSARKILPVVALHLRSASATQGAAGRRGPRFRKTMRHTIWKQLEQAMGNRTRQQTALQIGMVAPEVTRHLARHYGRVLLVDIDQVTQRGADRWQEANRAYRRKASLGALAEFSNIEVLHAGAGSPDSILRRATPIQGEISLIYLSGEPALPFFHREIQHWIGCLQPDGWLMGGYYGFPGFPETTPLIEAFLGSPVWRDAMGNWAMPRRTLHPPRMNLRRKRIKDPRGIVVWAFDEQDSALVPAALASLRRRWRGEVAVLACPPPLRDLGVACAQFDAQYLPDGGGADRLVHRPREAAALFSLSKCPFIKSLFVQVRSPAPVPDRWFRELERNPPCVASACTAGFPTLAFHREHPEFLSWNEQLEREGTQSDDWRDTRVRTALSQLARRTIPADRANPLANPETIKELTGQTRPRVWIPADTTMLTALVDGDLAFLWQNWAAVDWSPKAPRLICSFITQPPEEVKFPMDTEVIAVDREWSRAMPHEPYWVQALAAALRVVRTRYLIYLDPRLSPRPGAHLFCPLEEPLPPYLGAGWTFARIGEDLVPIPRIGPPASFFEVEWLRSALAKSQMGNFSSGFEFCLHQIASREGHKPDIYSVFSNGWS